MSRAGTSGLRNWFIQRLSAVYILAFAIIFVIAWAGDSLTYQSWKEWVAQPLANAGLLLFIASLLVHAWVGVRDVIIDYIKSVVVRYVLLVLIALTLLGLALWTLKILLLVSMA